LFVHEKSLQVDTIRLIVCLQYQGIHVIRKPQLEDRVCVCACVCTCCRRHLAPFSIIAFRASHIFGGFHTGFLGYTLSGDVGPTKESDMDGIWIAEGWTAFAIAMMILLAYSILLYLLVRSEF
jgi:hypothetical protein